MPTELKFPRCLLSRMSSHSPWKILNLIAVWSSTAVENNCDFLVRKEVLREMSLVMMLLSVLLPAKRINLVMPEDGDDRGVNPSDLGASLE